MQAERLILETDDQGHLLGLPDLPPLSRVEAIFLLLPRTNNVATRRTPPLELAGKLKIHGDIVSPVIPEGDWDALK